jgi:hypothetical protein
VLTSLSILLQLEIRVYSGLIEQRFQAKNKIEYRQKVLHSSDLPLGVNRRIIADARFERDPIWKRASG